MIYFLYFHNVRKIASKTSTMDSDCHSSEAIN